MTEMTPERLEAIRETSKDTRANIERHRDQMPPGHADAFLGGVDITDELLAHIDTITAERDANLLNHEAIMEQLETQTARADEAEREALAWKHSYNKLADANAEAGIKIHTHFGMDWRIVGHNIEFDIRMLRNC